MTYERLWDFGLNKIICSVDLQFYLPWGFVNLYAMYYKSCIVGLHSIV